MKKIVFILSLTLIVLLSACDDSSVVKSEWQIAQELGFQNVTRKVGSDGYNSVTSLSNDGFIVYKEITDGNGAKPLFTDKVKVLYTGWYKRDWSKGDTYQNAEGQIIKNKLIFDSTSFRANNPSTFSVAATTGGYYSSGGLIDGMSTALQNMEVGDKWEVWMPQELGYGGSAQTSIPGYTTLVFEIELLEIVK